MKKIMSRKLTVIILALAMVFTLMPMTQASVGYAAEPNLNAQIDGNGILKWDEIGTVEVGDYTVSCQYFVYINGLVDRGENYTYDLNSRIEYLLERGLVQNTGTYHIELKAKNEEFDYQAADWEYDYNYNSSTVGPEITEVRINDEEGYISWGRQEGIDSAKFYIDGVPVDFNDGDKGFELIDTIDEFVQEGKIENNGSHILRLEAYTEYYDCEHYENIQVIFAIWEETYMYTSPYEGPADDFPEGMVPDVDEGYVSWRAIKGANCYKTFVDDVLFYSSDHRYEYFNYAIDNMIYDRIIDKDENDTYTLKVEAWGEESSEPIAIWEITYRYHSEAEPGPDEFIFSNIEDDGHLMWQRIPQIYYYSFELGDNLETSEGAELDVYDFIDRTIENGQIQKQSQYDVLFKAYRMVDGEEVLVAQATYSLEYDSLALSPGSEFHYTIDTKNGLLRWNKIYGADYYQFEIEGYNSRKYDSWERSEYLENTIFNLIDDGIISKKTEYTVTLYAYKYDADDNVELLTSTSFVYEYTYKEAEIFQVSIENKRLIVTHSDGSEITEAAEYLVAPNGFWSDKYRGDLPENVEDFIDKIIRETEYFIQSDIYDFQINVYDYEGNCLGTGYIGDYYYHSKAEYEGDDTEGMWLANEQGILSWMKKKADHYLVEIGNTGEALWLDKKTTSINLYLEIDKLISKGVLAKDSSYDVNVKAVREDGSILVDVSQTYNYESKAEVGPETFEFTSYDSLGMLNWKTMKGVDYYTVSLGNDQTILNDASLATHEYIDKLIVNGDVAKQDEYVLQFKAYHKDGENGDILIDEQTYTVNYLSDAPEPAAELLYADIDTANDGLMSWNMVDDAEYYRFTIDGVSGTTTDRTICLDEIITEWTEQGLIEDKPEHTIVLEAYQPADESSSGSFRKAKAATRGEVIIGEPIELSYTFKVPVLLDADITDQILTVKYSDGSELVGVSEYVVKVDGFSRFNSGLPLNIEDYIDNLIKANNQFARKEEEPYKIIVYAYDEYGKEIGHAITTYEFASEANYITQDEIDLIREGNSISWEPVDGADHYDIAIGYNKELTTCDSETTEFNVADFVDSKIDKGWFKDEQAIGYYPIYVYAADDKTNYLATGKIGFDYKSEVEPAAYLAVHIADDGMLTWDEVSGADHYIVGIEDSYGVTIDQTSANIDEILDEAIANGYMSPDNKYNISVEALGDNDVLLAKWTKGKYMHELGGELAFKSHQVVLSGQIGMYFYMTIPSKLASGTMTFTVGDRTTEAEGVLQNDGRYKFTCYINSVEMAEKIHAEYEYTDNGETKTVSDEISVKEYLDALIGNEEYAAAAPLAKAIYNYGYYAMKALPGGTKHPEMPGTYANDADLIDTLTGYGISANLDMDLITGASYSLSLDSETAVNVYLTTENELIKDDVSVSAPQGTTFDYIVEKDGDRYRVKITGIGAHELGSAFTIQVGETTITASALSYVQLALASSNTEQKVKNAAAALYAYYEKTMEYRN